MNTYIHTYVRMCVHAHRPHWPYAIAALLCITLNSKHVIELPTLQSEVRFSSHSSQPQAKKELWVSANLKNPGETNPSNTANLHFNAALPTRCRWVSTRARSVTSRKLPIIPKA